MRRIRVLLFSKYSRRGASSRLRSLQYLPLLRGYGIDVEVRPLFSDEYLDAIFRGNSRGAMMNAWRRGARRFKELLRNGDHDVAWIEGELFPYLPSMVESLLARSVKPYVVDYDDALFHRYDLSSNRLVRGLLGRKIDRVMRDAACVVAGNSYLAERAARAGAPRIEVIPTVVDERRYQPVVHEEDRGPVIGWIGSPLTENYLLDQRDVLEKVCVEHGARLLLVGANPAVVDQFKGFVPEVLPWTEESEAAAIARMDIGIMPLRDGPWERGKCGYKLIQYMACGLPVVASRVGANIDIVRHGESGFLATDSASWEDSLVQLIKDRPVRLRMGQAGRMAVEQTYCLQTQAPRLAEVLHSVGQSRCAA
jgi:glycosyltransferase involved in cell wall biosynthesis